MSVRGTDREANHCTLDEVDAVCVKAGEVSRWLHVGIIVGEAERIRVVVKSRCISLELAAWPTVTSRF